MPRNASDIFSILPGTEGVPDTTIESAKYNAYIHDVEADLNAPRPIIAGGTDANNADTALFNLGAEKSSQKVLNYDTHVFRPGSLYSDIAATASPVAGHAFVGWAVSSDPPADPPANLNVVVHARDQTTTVPAPGRLYVREKKAGAWGTWNIDGSGIAGDTPPPSPADGALFWDNTDGNLYVYYNDGNSKQWVIACPQPDVGQFLLKAGDTMLGPLTLQATPAADLQAANKKYVDDSINSAAAGIAPSIAGKVSKTGDVMSGPLTAAFFTATSGGYRFVNNAQYLSWDGASFVLQGGPLVLNSNSLIVGLGGADGVIRFGNSGSQYLYYNGSSFQLTAALSVAGGVTFYGDTGLSSTSPNVVITAGGGGAIYLRPGGVTTAGQLVLDPYGNLIMAGQVAGGACSFLPADGWPGGFQCKDGVGTGRLGNYFNFAYSGGNVLCYIDRTYMGALQFQSDYRIKKDIAPLSGMWDTVKALNPITYTHQDYTPALEMDQAKETGKPFVQADDIERWGFIAHELQDTLTGTAATAEKDAPSAIQAINPMPVIAALTKALQEAMARIEALEAKVT